MSTIWNTRAIIIGAVLLTAGAAAARAQNTQNATIFGDIETAEIFGFTEGSGIGLEGEKEISLDNEARIGKRDGRYFASDSKLGFEFTPNQYVQIEFGPLLSARSISDVTDLDNRHQVTFGGAFGEFKYLLLERGASSPLSVTLSAEPEWKRVNGEGERVTELGIELKANADLELVKNRFYLGANLLYEPEVERVSGEDWERESTFGVSGALSYRIVPSVFVGAELWYLRHYDSLGFNQFTGDAVYLGPTLYVQLSRKAFLRAAWNVQVSGRDVENPGSSLNLGEFSRHRAKLKLGFEF